MSKFRTALESGKVLLMDGAMGTEILRRLNVPATENLATLSCFQPDLVRSIHADYVDAGADVLLTNTFQANYAALLRWSLDYHPHDIWQAAIEAAHLDHPRRHFVLADVGPFEPVTLRAARDILGECVGVDGLLLETWSSLDAIKWFGPPRLSGGEGLGMRGHSGPRRRPLTPGPSPPEGREEELPLLISFTFHRTGDLMTFIGARPEQCAAAAKRSGAAAIGANCGKEIGMADLLEIVRRFRSECDLPIFVRPNAGSPTKSGLHYPRTPAAMAAALPDLLEAGVTMVGGCCGTTPEHIRAFRAVIDEWNALVVKKLP